MLGEVGAWGVNLHDNDLVPIDATPAERDRIVKEFKQALRRPRHRRADGDGEPVLRPGLPRRRLHRQRSARCAPTRCRRRCARWTSARSSARRSSCSGAGAKAPRPTPAAGRTKPSSGCATRSTTCASTRSTRSTATSSRSKPSRTSRAATSTWRRRATTSGSSRRSLTRTWSA